MKKKTRRAYKKHLKRVKTKYGFFPQDFKETLKCMYKSLERYGVG